MQSLLAAPFYQGFETRTRPYGLTGKTSNKPFLRFVKHEEPFHAKKSVNRTDHSRTSRFCEPWSVQVVHMGPLFQALNGTVLDSLPCFFLLYGVVWTLELDYSLKQETLASLSELSASLSHSNYISHLCLSPSLPSATTDLNPDHSSPHSHLCLSPSSPLATALSFVKLDQVK